MTKDDIIRMAREVWGEQAILPFDDLERFAAMVATAVDMDAKNKANASLKVKCKEKVVAEREECAKVCDKKARDTINPVAEVFYKDCAASIRLRGHQ